MEWEWKEMPPTCLEVKAGERVDLSLDLEWLGQPGAIQWEPTRLGKAKLQTDPQEPRQASVQLHPSEHGLLVVSYDIQGSPLLQGMILLRVAPALLDQLPTPQAPVHTQSVERREPEQDPKTQQQATPQEPAVGVNQESRELPPGVYQVEVWRGHTHIDALTKTIPQRRRMIIGRYSRSLGLLPDIDLAGHFPTAEAEHYCARRQACVYWSGKELHVSNLGLNPLERRCPDGTREPLPQQHAWLPGEFIELPGGLSLLLKGSQT